MVSTRKAVFSAVLISLVVLLIGACTAVYCADNTPGEANHPKPMLAEDCIKFNPDKVEWKQINGRWKVVQGDMWMLDFDQSESEAKSAVRIIQHYKMDSQCYVGRPGPSMEYWLVGGKSPVGPISGEDAIPFNPSTTEVKQINGSWKIVDGDHWILDFAGNEGEARAALSLILKYGFNHICFVGRPNAGMTYFRKDKTLLTPVGLSEVLQKQPILPAISEDCIKFHPDQVEWKKIEGRWKVVQGDMWMLDFDQSESEAKSAVRIIRHYKMDSQCYVGRPGPSMEYWLVGGKSPVGPISGEDAIPFNPSTTEVKQINGSWKVVDGDHWILDFAGNEGEAHAALSLILKYGFDHICFVGRPDPGMTYFRRDKVLLTPVGLSGVTTIPQLPALQITATLKADPDSYTGAYPVTVKFKGSITASAACVVEYTFARSDGAIGPTYHVRFSRAATKKVGTTWTLSADYTGWEQIKISAPVVAESPQAAFKLKQAKLFNPQLHEILPR